jgi:hypothetical protein
LKSLPPIQLYMLSRQNEKSPVVKLLRDLLFSTLQRSMEFLGAGRAIHARAIASGV